MSTMEYVSATCEAAPHVTHKLHVSQPDGGSSRLDCKIVAAQRQQQPLALLEHGKATKNHIDRMNRVLVMLS